MNASVQNITTAHREWASRPSDERFGSLSDLRGVCAADRDAAKLAAFKWGGVEVGVDAAGSPVLAGSAGGYASLNAWSFGQLCGDLGAPRRYLASLPGELAAECLNHALTTLPDDRKTAEGRLLLDRRAAVPTVRSISSPAYSRIWDVDVIDRVAGLGGAWKLPLQYEGGHWGGPLVPGGAYRGDRDLFLFMVDESKRINDGSEGGLSRGFFVRNSEVGARSFSVTTFLYRHVCGNNIVWGARGIVEKRIRHVGEASTKAFAELRLALTDYAEASASEDEAAIARAQSLLLGADEEEVVAQVVKVTTCPKKLAAEAYTTASQWAEVDGAANTVWGMVNGITRYAQLSKWTDDRVETDLVAQQLFVRTVLS